ncbi:MAG: TetR/AcrR family transcriptional regulator [Actinomycetota bacterium]|nr:TetR/AcrR family transcriptional regulator [Actinomycetota bacterium]
MSIPYELQGRRRQKARTRGALVDAARRWLSDGITPTVEQAAERAGIARTTAYRYFPNQRALLLATYPELDAPSLLDADAPLDAATRLDLVTKRFTRQVLDHEAELRATLRVALEPDGPKGDALPLRQGRGIRWIEDALTPLQGQMPDAELRRLVLAIRAGIGIEALVWLTDIGKLSRDEAVATMRWSAQTLLHSALQGLDAK